jgi:penicillin-binding protein 1A
MAIALAKSRNCASAYIMKQLDNTANNGAKRFVEFLEKCELKTKIDPYPSIALGACEISLYEMMQAYSMFPGRGFNAKPMYITRIEDRNGNVLATFTPQRKEVINDVTAYSVIKMMQGVLTNGTGAGIWGYGIPGGLQVAGKTGTTNNNSDAWFMGYTPQYLAGGWVGCDDRFIRFDSKNGEGGRAAMPIWAYFFNKAAADPNCGIDTKLSFVKPEVMSNDIIIDYINGTNPILGGEGEDMGTGTSEDYELTKNIKPEELGAESDLIIDNKKTTTPPSSPANNTPKPADKPKAILPPPVKKPGGNK